jgi:hypothetical protein
MKKLEIDILEDAKLLEEDFLQAEADIKEFSLDFEFDSVDELYLDDEEQAQKWYEI